ncbi:hypothetical protein ACFL1X_10865, partial [Candidatus Hydrogenedentota bacterium]
SSQLMVVPAFVHATGQTATCGDCHDIHEADGNREDPADNSMCVGCHEYEDNAAIKGHTRHSVDPSGTGASRCTTCHLPPLQREDQDEGRHDHKLTGIPPVASKEAADAGVDPVPPNSCAGIVGCHDGAVPGPVFDVDDLDFNAGTLQGIFEAFFGD